MGGSAMFSSSASGVPTPTYVWQQSTNGGSTWTDVPGATAPNWSQECLTKDNGTLFRFVATNSTGKAVSQTAKLSVAQ